MASRHIPRQSDSKRNFRAFANRLGETLNWCATHEDVQLASQGSFPFVSVNTILVRAIRLGWDGITEEDAVRIIDAYLADPAQSLSYHVASWLSTTLLDELRQERERREVQGSDNPRNTRNQRNLPE